MFFSASAYSQEMLPNWYVLEKGASVGILKPGVNDLIMHLTTAGAVQINREEIDKVNKKIVYQPGHTILVYANTGKGVFMATDVEGRTLLVKGNVTKAEYGSGCSPAYVMHNVQLPDGTMLKYGSYIWVKRIEGNNAVVQYANKKDFSIPLKSVVKDKNGVAKTVENLYIVDETAGDMLKDTKMRVIE